MGAMSGKGSQLMGSWNQLWIASLALSKRLSGASSRPCVNLRILLPSKKVIPAQEICKLVSISNLMSVNIE